MTCTSCIGVGQKFNEDMLISISVILRVFDRKSWKLGIIFLYLQVYITCFPMIIMWFKNFKCLVLKFQTEYLSLRWKDSIMFETFWAIL